MTRVLTKTELTLWIIIGLFVASVSIYSDRNDEALMSSLKQEEDTIVALLSKKTSVPATEGGEAVARAAAAKIDQLQSEVSALQHYKNQHEAEEWPALNADQQQEWVIALSKYSGQLRAIQLIDVDSRGELLVDSLLKVFRAAHLPEPTIGTDGIGQTNGLRIAGQPKEVGDTAKHLFEKLGYKVPPVAEMRASEPMLQIMIGRRD